MSTPAGRDLERPSTFNADLLEQWETVMLTRDMSDNERRSGNQLYAYAEDASYHGLSLEEAIQYVVDGYSSAEADRLSRADP